MLRLNTIIPALLLFLICATGAYAADDSFTGMYQEIVPAHGEEGRIGMGDGRIYAALGVGHFHTAHALHRGDVGRAERKQRRDTHVGPVAICR